MKEKIIWQATENDNTLTKICGKQFFGRGRHQASKLHMKVCEKCKELNPNSKIIKESSILFLKNIKKFKDYQGINNLLDEDVKNFMINKNEF